MRRSVAILDDASLRRHIQRFLLPITRWAIVPQVPGTEFSPLAPHLGGFPYIEHGERWPKCDGCEHDLEFICQVDNRDDWHATDFVPFFTFYYCWRCVRAGGADPVGWAVRTYHQPREEAADRSYVPEEPRHWPASINPVPDDSAPGAFELAFAQAAAPKSLRNVPLEKWIEVAEALEVHEEPVGAADTFVGGYPRWVGQPAVPTCGACDSYMDLLIQLGSSSGYRWGNNGAAYIFGCRDHPEQISFVRQTTNGR
jgi:hypothetical protein